MSTGRLVFRSQEIYAEDGVVDGHVVIAGGRIEAIRPGDPPPDGGARVVDVRPHRIFPGFIDLHIHGAGGWNVDAADVDELHGLCRYVAAWGVTALQPTVSALPPERLEAVARAVRAAMAAGPQGARILGLHLEGPYLNAARRGAMDPRLFRNPSREEIEHLMAAAPGTVRHVTLAPELPGALDFIRWLAGRGDVTVAGGHTDATYDQTRAGIDAGIRVANHTYNAMRGLQHREPGALGAYVLDGRVMCELIADGRHVHPAAMEILLRVAGRDRICLVSDAVPPAGLPEGRYALFGREVAITAEGYCLLPDGTLAGSAHMLVQGVRNLVEMLGVPVADAVRMASLNPARVARVDRSKGSLAPGKDADLTVVSTGWEPLWTVVEGRVVHAPDRAPPPPGPAARRSA